MIHPMNYFDVIFLVILVWSAYRGLTRGFIIMAASLAALVLGIWGAIRFSDITAGLLTGKLQMEPRYIGLAAFALTFVAIVIAVHLVARAADKLVKAVALGFANRLLGLAFAVLKNAFIISIVLVILNTINERRPFLPGKQIEESFLYVPLSRLAPTVFPYLNFDRIRQKFRQEDDEGLEV